MPTAPGEARTVPEQPTPLAGTGRKPGRGPASVLMAATICRMTVSGVVDVGMCVLLLGRAPTSASNRASKLAERAVDELHAHRALTDGRRDAFDASRSDVADGEDARPAPLEQLGSASERPDCVLEVARVEVSSGPDEALGVQHHATLQPRRVRVGARHQEKVAVRTVFPFLGGDV